jgi:hypothetical protein
MIRRPGRRARWGFGAVTITLAAGLAGWLLLVKEGGESVTADAVTGGIAMTGISKADLERAGRTRVFFGHQSVGMNILQGVPGVFSAQGVPVPPIQDRRTMADTSGGFIAQTPIGQNTDPLQKIQDFDSVIRSGLGSQLDVAVLKFCYIDVAPGTDVDALFATYRNTLAALQRDYPQVTFVKVTVPLTTRPPLLSRLKQAVRGDDSYGATANVARERLNELIRKEYAGDHLFDLAAVESTAPDGSRVSGRSGGRPYFALADSYAADSGHLNADGSNRAATAFLAAVAGASSR